MSPEPDRLERARTAIKELLSNLHKPWRGAVGALLAVVFLYCAGIAAATDKALAVCLTLGSGALFLSLCWFLVWAGGAQENAKESGVLRRIEALWRFLGFAGLLSLAVLGLDLSFDKVIDKIPGAAADPGWREKAVSASTVIVRAAEHSMGWPQAVVLLAIILSMTVVVVALIFAAAQYFKD